MKFSNTFSATAVTCLIQTAHCRDNTTSKRGLALIADTSNSDLSLFTAEKSPISWYYTWSPYQNPAMENSSVEFFPLLHGVDAVEDDELMSLLDQTPSSSTHILTFNEPDHDKDSGGSDISPKDAAKAYMEYVVPLREGKKGSRTWNISHPVVTSSEKGIEWLRDFNESCYKLDEKNGCPTDFVAIHYYGDYPGLRGWLGTLDEFYNVNGSSDSTIPFWITEMALPGEDEDANLKMLNESMSYLDNEDLIEGYAWFGAFRTDDSKEWTGDGVSMFDDDGGLTKLGAEYLGGDDNGFEEGEEGDAEDDDEGAAGLKRPASVLAYAMLAVAASLLAGA